MAKGWHRISSHGGRSGNHWCAVWYIGGRHSGAHGCCGHSQNRGVLWDRLFLPLLAASVASMTMIFVGAEQLSPPAVPDIEGVLIQLLSAAVAVACVGALVGVAGTVFFQPLFSLFRRLQRPWLFTSLGGILLDAVGALGGPLTVF